VKVGFVKIIQNKITIVNFFLIGGDERFLSSLTKILKRKGKKLLFLNYQISSAKGYQGELDVSLFTFRHLEIS
jgi:hypothetical protein